MLVSPDCLLARVLRGKYFPETDFLHVTAPSNCSHGWREILVGRDLIKNHVGWAIGNGEEVNVWNEPWLSTSSWESPIGPPTRDSEFLKVASLFLPSEKDWDSGKVQSLLPHLHDKILSIKTSKQEGKDKRIWLKKSSGIYSTKTGYYTALELKRQQEGFPTIPNGTWLSDVWKLTIPPKIKMFLWKLKHEAVPVNARLHARQIIPSPKCTFCDEEETILHLFFQCPFAVQVWNGCPFSSNPLNAAIESINAGLQVVMKATPLPPSGVS